MRRLALCVVAAAAAILAGAGSVAAQERVGVDSAVNPQATATPPGEVTRRVTIGAPVLFNEHFATGAAGQAQILFLDQSAMTIGPNSDMTIDKFVYDPHAGTGRLAMNAARGILRFVGGKLSKHDKAVTLQTPSATLAVRGGVFLADLSGNGRLDVYFIYGVGVSVTGTNGITQSVRRPGFAITVLRPGAAPSAAYRAPIGRLARLLAAVDGRPGSSGGTPNPPDEETIVSSGISSVISGDIPASLQAAAETQPPPSQPKTVTPTSVQSNSQTATVAAQGTPGVALLEGNQTLANSATTGSTTRVSYPLAGFAAIDTATIFSGHVKHSFVEPATAVLLNGVLSASASNAAVSFPLAPGFSHFGPQGTSSTFGAVTGSGYLAPDDAFFYAEGTSASYPNKIGVVVGGLPTIDVPTTGIGSFSGSLTGLVDNGGSIYLATGTFTNVYNFASGTGTFTISNFDGKTLSGAVAAIGTPGASAQSAASAQGITLPANIGNLIYAGALTGSGLQGGVGGAFFGNNAADTGGAFGVHAPSGTYKAAGLFGGHR